MPYIYIEKLLTELRPELLSAMHQAVAGEGLKKEVDVARLYRSFTRAAGGKMANPVMVSEKVMEENPGRTAKMSRKGKEPVMRVKGLGSAAEGR